VVDDGSTNGTRVNGAVLPRGRRKALRDGDVLTVGNFAVRVSLVMGRGDSPERTASLARRLLLDGLSTQGDEAAPPRFVLLTGKRAGDAWVLPMAPSRVVIGREAGCEVLLDDRDCSRQHAEVLRDTEGVTVRDLGSKNGFVAGGRVLSEKRLRHGDELTFGQTVLRYHDPTEELLRSFESGADEVAPPALDPLPVVAQSSPPEAPVVESAPVSVPAAEAPATEGPAPAEMVVREARIARARFDWVVVMLAVVILVVSASALVLLLYGGRGRL
jgi:pSer/pThr/pTyr-binding forkhead associated (FHA) protein